MPTFTRELVEKIVGANTAEEVNEAVRGGADIHHFNEYALRISIAEGNTAAAIALCQNGADVTNPQVPPRVIARGEETRLAVLDWLALNGCDVRL